MKDKRKMALRSFATAISIFTIFGHLLLGFEQSWVHVVASLLAAYSMEILLELIDSRAHKRPHKIRGTWLDIIDFMLPAHITGLAVAMLIYPNVEFWPMAFGSACGIASKYMFRVNLGENKKHFLNPSNFGIAVVLLVFPWVGIAPPYQFTGLVNSTWEWLLPVLILCSGSMLNARLTGKIPLILGWVGGFVLQAILRALILGTPLVAKLLPITGPAFVLFTFYMVSDPGTTPQKRWPQVAFGASVAGVYGILLILHVVYTFFFALVIVCVIRGTWLWLLSKELKKSHSSSTLMVTIETKMETN